MCPIKYVKTSLTYHVKKANDLMDGTIGVPLGDEGQLLHRGLLFILFIYSTT